MTYFFLGRTVRKGPVGEGRGGRGVAAALKSPERDRIQISRNPWDGWRVKMAVQKQASAVYLYSLDTAIETDVSSQTSDSTQSQTVHNWAGCERPASRIAVGPKDPAHASFSPKYVSHQLHGHLSTRVARAPELPLDGLEDLR